MVMFLGIVISVVLGVFCGIFTGLFPGIHVNLISVLLLSLSPVLLGFTTALNLCVFIISLAITHSFLDSLPSIYLGAPDEAMALSVLPGHKLLHRGEGHNAILCTVIGSYGCLLLSLIVFPLFLVGMKVVYPLIDSLIGYILILIMALMIMKERGKRLITLCCFLLAGSLGILVLSMKSLSQPLFPLLSGLFGFSIMIVSLMQSAIVPVQDFGIKLKLPFTSAIRSVFAATGVGFVAAFLPGFGNSQAAIVANEIVGKKGTIQNLWERLLALVKAGPLYSTAQRFWSASRFQNACRKSQNFLEIPAKDPRANLSHSKELETYASEAESFLVLTGGINTANMLISIGTVYVLSKARNGAIVAVRELVSSVTFEMMILFLLVALVVGSIASILTLYLSRGFSSVMSRLNYTDVIFLIMMLICVLTFIFDGFVGLLILITATSIGLFASFMGVGKNHLMGVLIVPVILYFIL
jgi:putative membrane protein